MNNPEEDHDFKTSSEVGERGELAFERWFLGLGYSVHAIIWSGLSRGANKKQLRERREARDARIARLAKGCTYEVNDALQLRGADYRVKRLDVGEFTVQVKNDQRTRRLKSFFIEYISQARARNVHAWGWASPKFKSYASSHIIYLTHEEQRFHVFDPPALWRWTQKEVGENIWCEFTKSGYVGRDCKNDGYRARGIRAPVAEVSQYFVTQTGDVGDELILR